MYIYIIYINIYNNVLINIFTNLMQLIYIINICMSLINMTNKNIIIMIYYSYSIHYIIIPSLIRYHNIYSILNNLSYLYNIMCVFNVTIIHL